jgi:hypothetical protein
MKLPAECRSRAASLGIEIKNPNEKYERIVNESDLKAA